MEDPVHDRPDKDAPPQNAIRHRVEGDGTLWIDWDDGHQTLIDPRRLRSGCPCAQCREEREAAMAGRFAEGGFVGMGDATEPEPRPPGSMRLISIVPVGRYGLAPTWADGHRTGIYSWDILRALCDCYACRLERDGG
jgi:DUF971 family protein